MNGQLELAVSERYPAARSFHMEFPDAYEQILAWAREDVFLGFRPSIDLYANILRRPHVARRLGFTRTGVVYKFNNNLRSELARYIRERHPDLDFEVRKSAHDDQGTYATPRAGGAFPS